MAQAAGRFLPRRPRPAGTGGRAAVGRAGAGAGAGAGAAARRGRRGRGRGARLLAGAAVPEPGPPLAAACPSSGAGFLDGRRDLPGAAGRQRLSGNKLLCGGASRAPGRVCVCVRARPCVFALLTDLYLGSPGKKSIRSRNRRWPLGPGFFFGRCRGDCSRCRGGVGVRAGPPEGFVNGASARGG